MRRAAAQVGAAMIVVAVVGYVAQFLAARWLGPAAYARFAVFWAVLFVIVGCLSGIAQEVIRVSRVTKLRADAGSPPDPHPLPHPRIAVLAVAISVGGALVVAVTGLFWGPRAFGGDWPTAVVLLTLAALLVGGGLSAGGMAAGLARWRTYALLVVLEGLARLVLFVVAALLVPTVPGFSIAAALAFVPGLLAALLWPELRQATFEIRSDSPTGESVTRILRSMAASGLSGLLVIGWPALLSAASGVNPRGSTAASLGVLVLLVTLTRTPIMVPLTSFQNVLVARFTSFDLRGRRTWVGAGTALIVVASGVLAGLAALLAPPLVPLVFGADYQVDAGLVAALTAAAAGLGIITLTGVAAITAARHTLYLLGWGVAIVATLLLLFLAPLPLDWATVLALAVGPLAGAAVQALALRAPRAAVSPSGPDRGVAPRAQGARP